MKKYRTTALMLVLLAGLTGCYLYMTRSDALEADIPLFEARNGIKSIEIAASNGRLNFVKNGGVWSAKGEPGIRLDQKKINSLEDTLIHLTASRIVENDTSNFQKYGLNKAEMAIKLKTMNGETETLLIGSETASKSQYYARNSRRFSVFTCEKVDINPFQNDISEYRDRSFITIDPHKVNSIGIQDSQQEFLVEKNHSGQWQFVSPVKTQVRGGAVKELLEAVFQMQVKDFVARPASDMAQYGFNKPLIIVRIGDSGGNTQTLLFGTTNLPNQAVFVKDAGSREIYTVSSNSFHPEIFKMGSLLEVAPLSVGIGEIQGITVMERGRTVEFTRAASQAGEDIFALSGKPLRIEDFNSFYLNIMALSAAGYDPANKGASPEMTVVLKRKGNPTIRADFSKRDQSSFYMTINGKPLPYYVTAEKLMLVRKWLQKIQTSS